MRALRLWLRRGMGLWVFPVMTGFLLAIIMTSHPWLLDTDWGLRATAGAAVIAFCPVLAAVVAYDVSRRVHPTLAEVARASSRGFWATLLPMVATFMWSLAAMVISWTVTATLVALAGGVASRDPWVYIETVAAYTAAVAAGALVGAQVRGVMAVVFAAGVVLATSTVLGANGIMAFQVVGSSGTMIGIDRTPARAVLAIAVNLSIAFLCIGAVLLMSGVRPLRRVALGALCIPVLASLVVQATLPIHDSEYRPTRQTQACVGSSPTVCGPGSATALLRVAQGDLAAARRRLQGSKLALPDRFVIARGDAVTHLGTSQTELPYDPSTLVDGRHLGRDAIVAALATPRACAALFQASTAPEYLQLISDVSEWLRRALEPGRVSPEAAPTTVRDAYAKLASCATPPAS